MYYYFFVPSSAFIWRCNETKWGRESQERWHKIQKQQIHSRRADKNNLTVTALQPDSPENNLLRISAEASKILEEMDHRKG